VKTQTDEHWNERARGIDDAASVNIEDVYQRDLELEFVCSRLTGNERLLEVGCGNGFNTTRYRDHVVSIDAFDFSEDMISRAKRDHPDPKIRYYQASVLDPSAAPAGTFDAVVCIRTLINLADLAAQRASIENLFFWLRPGGLLVLIEGFTDGFQTLGELRQSLGLPMLVPASINSYCAVAEIQDLLDGGGEVVATFHTGTWDVLTRVVLPLIAGPENVHGVGPFHSALLDVAHMLGNDRTEELARERGWAIRRFDT
jgi:SAM-dependent methyltransferase